MKYCDEFQFSLADLRALSGFLMVKKLSPESDLQIIFEIYAEIFRSDFQGFTEIFGLLS